MTATVRQVLAESEPRLPVLDVMPLSGRMAQRVSQDTLIARLTSIFSAIALFLACLGLYGTISYGINRRVPEIGLRMALGADRRSVLRLILREALLLVSLGAIVGVPLAYIAGRSLRTMLYEIPPLDPISYGARRNRAHRRQRTGSVSPRAQGIADRADAGAESQLGGRDSQRCAPNHRLVRSVWRSPSSA